jgi:ribosomal protein L32
MSVLKAWAELVGLQGLTTRIATPGIERSLIGWFAARRGGDSAVAVPQTEGEEFDLLAVPKKKSSVMRRRLRADGQRRRKNEQYVGYRMCPRCDIPVAPHFLCPKCKQVHGRF